MKFFNFCIILFLFVTLSINAQVDMEISDGLTVETTGSLVIELSGDLIENGTGYLKGKVSSGVRSGTTSFAGLTLSNGLNGTITRTTGTPYNASSPKTALRSYEVVNSSPALNTNVEADLITSSTNDERNGIEDYFLLTDISSTLKIYSDNGSTPAVVKAAGVDFPNGTTNLAISEGIGIGAKIFLEGPYQGGVTPLTDNLGTLPSLSPYTTEAPRTASSIPTQAVDWVMVELRSGTAASSSLGTRSAFVDVDGNLIQDDGSLGIGFPALPGTGYRMVIKHRNHLGIMSNALPALTWFSN